MDRHPDHVRRHPSPLGSWALVRGSGLIGLLLLFVYGFWMTLRLTDDPGLIYLGGHGGAAWIVPHEATTLATRPTGDGVRGFRIRFTVAAAVNDALLEVRGLRGLNVLLNGKLLLDTTRAPERWKSATVVQLAPQLAAGAHELIILVRNDSGPAALWAKCERLGLQTDTSWESSRDGTNWGPARLATDRASPELTREFPSPGRALGERAPWLILLFVAVALASDQLARRTPRRSFWSKPAAWRWVALSTWGLLAVHNLSRLPGPAGFDVAGHLEYIDYLIKNRRLPLATDGWQMFQSPLYYGLSAGLFGILRWFCEPDNAVMWLRALPLACGLGQIELSYRAVRRLWPERPDLQIIGTLFAALLPMNLYLSHYVGNEPLAGFLSACLFVTTLRWLRPTPEENNRWMPLWLGLLLGLALLTKVSTVLMAVPVVLAAGLATPTAGTVTAWLQRSSRTVAIILSLAGVIAGWYYLRNLIQLGRPFVGGWDMDRGFPWWQDPGYHVAGDFLTFGTSLFKPVAVSLVGFWDGLYATFWSDSFLSSATLAAAAPPWNHGAMAASVLLALVPSAAMLLGFGLSLRALWEKSDRVSLIVITTLVAYGVALLHHALSLPYYCAIKAFYSIGAMPAYVLILTTGVAWLSRHAPIRLITHGGLACWAVTVYLGFMAHG
jgi:hypothetical protein